jgi:GNAT superfamily N-acetyltransferase
MKAGESPYRCRLATEADFPALVIFGRHFYEQTQYLKVPYSPAGFADWCGLMLGHGLLFVADDRERLVGMIGGVSMPFIVNPEHRVGAELIWWLEPDHRGTGAGDLMMDAIEAAAKELGCVYWSMMSLEAVNPAAAARIYTRRGYKLAEHTFCKEL